jgi:D-amino-acid oxidase
MKHGVAIVGGGISGLTCGVLLAERGYRAAIFAKETGQQTTSSVAAAMWYPYDAEPTENVIAWALDTYNVLVDLSGEPRTGVSMMELRQFSRAGEIQIPDWANSLGASVILSEGKKSPMISPSQFKSGFALTVPLMDTTIYLDYLASRFLAAGGSITSDVFFEKLEDVDNEFVRTEDRSGLRDRLR